MTHIATSGTFSCAAISIAGFKGGNYKANEKYRKDGSVTEIGGGNREKVLGFEKFYEEVLYPVDQPLGWTKDYPFDWLMDKIDRSDMRGKMIFAILNDYQAKVENDGYWDERLKARGFKVVDVTYNVIGGVCWLYMRNLNQLNMDTLEWINPEESGFEGERDEC